MSATYCNENEYKYDMELFNQPYDFSSPIYEEDTSPTNPPLTTNLGKRKYADSFDPATYEDTRYCQRIADDFFKNNIGHGVHVSTHSKNN